MQTSLCCGDRWLDLSQPVIMGVLNITPDSFSDGGQFLQQDAALRRAEQLLAEGAHIIDLGAESTRPGAQHISPQQELDRLLPVLTAIKANFDTIVSIDSSSPEVMTAAAAAGAGLLNDVRALQRDGALAAAAATGLPICLMHMRGEPATMQQMTQYTDVLSEVMAFIEQRIADCQAAGIVRERLILDPGFGFAKTLPQNLALLRHLQQWQRLDLPLLVGMSRKSMLGAILGGAPVDQRLYAGLAAATLAAWQGAHIIRTHDVAATRDVLAVVSAVLASEHS